MRVIINSKNLQNKLVIENIKIRSKELKPIILLEGDIFYEYKGFKIRENFDFEAFDIEEFLQQLLVLEKDLKRAFIFGDSEERVKIEFLPENDGSIKVSGRITDLMRQNVLNFMFYTDQTFLPSIKRDLQNILNRIERLN